MRAQKGLPRSKSALAKQLKKRHQQRAQRQAEEVRLVGHEIGLSLGVEEHRQPLRQARVDVQDGEEDYRVDKQGQN